MKMFVEFLKENKVDEDLVENGKERYFKFNESGKVIGYEDDISDNDDFETDTEIPSDEPEMDIEIDDTEEDSLDDTEVYDVSFDQLPDEQDIRNANVEFDDEINQTEVDGDYDTDASQDSQDIEDDDFKNSDFGKTFDVSKAFGGERYFDVEHMPFGDNNNDYEYRAVAEDSETIAYLKRTHPKDINSNYVNDQVRYQVVPANGKPTAKKPVRIMTKNFTEDVRRELTDAEGEEIAKRKSFDPSKVEQKTPTDVKIQSDGTLFINNKKIAVNRRVNFIKDFNALIEKALEKGIITLEKNYNFKEVRDKETGQLMLTPILLVNINKWDNTYSDHRRKFQNVKYKPVTSQKEINIFKQLYEMLNDKIKRDENGQIIQKPITKKAVTYTWNKEKKTFAKNGVPMYGEELLAFVYELNGKYDSKKTDVRFDKATKGSYYEHFKISDKGSKVGDVANFSLPPVITCNKQAPCIDDGCYAIKAYAMYPTTRMAQLINLKLLNEGRYDQFVNEVSQVLEYGEFKYFRFFVSGDLYTTDLLKAICRIAQRNSNVGFWLYTKQYHLIHQYKSAIPSNLTIILSCWGKFRPSLYMKKANEKESIYAYMEKKFPLAYLNDNTENTTNFFDVKENDFVCPCTSSDQNMTHCDKCDGSATPSPQCYMVGKGKGNIIFNKH